MGIVAVTVRRLEGLTDWMMAISADTALVL